MLPKQHSILSNNVLFFTLFSCNSKTNPTSQSLYCNQHIKICKLYGQWNNLTQLVSFYFFCSLFFASLRNLISSFLRMEGMVNLNITDTQRASNLSKNLSSIVLHKTGASNKIFPQKFDENLTLERKPLTKYMSTRDLWQFYFLSAISAFIWLFLRFGRRFWHFLLIITRIPWKLKFKQRQYKKNWLNKTSVLRIKKIARVWCIQLDVAVFDFAAIVVALFYKRN